MKRAYMFNTGCIRRALDCTRIYEYLVLNGWAFTKHIPSADLIVISTCGTIRKNEELSLTAIKNITRKKSQSARVIITGCLPKINPARIGELGDFELVPTRDLEMFDSVLNSSTKFREVPDANMVSNDLGFLDYVLAYRLFRNSYSIKLYIRLSTSRKFLKFCIFAGEAFNIFKSKLGLALRKKIVPYYNLRIAEGCAFACSYCAIKFATGRLRSKPIDKIVDEFQQGLKLGYKVFQLVCEDTGCYGLDIGTTVPVLLRRIFEVKGDYQIIVIDFGGYWLVKYYDELLPILKNNADKIRELYVSLQSGSDRVLRAMKRPEESEDVKAKLKELKEKIPQLDLRTTVIIGFPGETEEDFMKTVEAIKEIDFSEVQLNKYEDRPGTVSSTMEDKLPQELIDRRYEVIKQYC